MLQTQQLRRASLELLELLNSIGLSAGAGQNRDDYRDRPCDRRCALLEIPRVVRLDGPPPRRHFRSKRELLVLFPDSHLHCDQRRSYVVELAVSAVTARRK